MENTKYLIEHRQGGVEIIYGYYDNVMEVNEKLSILGKSEIKDSQDDISVLRLDVHEMEDKYEMPLEEIDTRDVADESKWIKYAFPKTKLEWDLDELVLEVEE